MKTFHSLDPQRGPTLLDLAFLEKLTAETSAGRAVRSFCPPDTLRRIENSLKCFTGVPKCCEQAQEHGDFGPGNVLVNGDGVAVCDLSSTRSSPVVADAATFVATLTLCMLSRGATPAFDSGIHEPLSDRIFRMGHRP